MINTGIVSNVANKLNYLKNEWNETVIDNTLIYTISILRSLLIEKEYPKAWREIGNSKEPRVYAPDLIEVIKGLPLEKISFAQVGGARFGGGQAQSICFGKYALSPDQIKQRYESQSGIRRVAYHISGFIESPCLVIEGQLIKRRELIKYIANKMGGVHWDAKREKDDIAYQLLDNHVENNPVKILDKDAIYYEILSIGQCIADSEDASTFLMRVSKCQDCD